MAGALGCALGSMVAEILLSRPKIRAAERRVLRRQKRDLEKIGRQLERLMEKDAQAYRALVLAQRRGKGLLKARAQAIDCPAQICRTAAEALRLLKDLSRRTGPYLGSDLKAGAALLRGASEAAQAMVEVNQK